MFELMLLLDVSQGRAGMLIPVFSSATTNMPYVQQMNEYLLVKEMVPFLEYENYPCVVLGEAKATTIGDRGIISFRSTDGSLVTGDFETVLHYCDNNRELIGEDHLLQMQLQRIESAELPPSYELWRTVAAEIFKEPGQAKLWVDSELHLFQKEQRIWSEIDTIDPDEFEAGDGPTLTALFERSTEYLLRWLGNRNNFRRKNWTKVWHYVHEKIPFDERVRDVAVSWMYSLNSDVSDFQETRSIIYALLQLWSLTGKDYPDYGDFLSDRLASEPSLLFICLRPAQFFRLLFEYILAKGNIPDLLTLAEFTISNLPKEGYIVDSVTSVLTAIVKSRHFDGIGSATAPDRQFDYRYISAAGELLDKLNAYRA
jgi:hypothetical protein